MDSLDGVTVMQKMKACKVRIIIFSLCDVTNYGSIDEIFTA